MVGELGENEIKDPQKRENEIKVSYVAWICAKTTILVLFIVDVKGIRDNIIYNMSSDVQLLMIIIS